MKAAKIRLEQPELEAGRVLALSGYAETVAKKNPGYVLNSQGYKKALQNFGLTEKLIKTALVADIKGKPKDRARELTLGAEILKLKDDPQKGDTYNTIIFADERAKRIARRILISDSESKAKFD